MKKIWKIGITSIFIVLLAFGFSKETQAESVYKRVYGSDRLNTAIEISKTGWPRGLENAEKAVILARADDPADALSAASLAGAKDAPILLTQTDSISWKVLNELERLKASKIYVLGGEKAISRRVVSTLQSSKYNVVRISGSGRYQTAFSINKIAGTNLKTKAIVVNGTAVADALSASTDSALNNIPIYLTTKYTLPVNLPSTIKTVDLYGGTEVISRKVEDELKRRGIKVNRFSGSGRYETNVKALNSIQRLNKAILVRGTSVQKDKEDFPDAVVASGLANRLGAAVVLSDEKQAIPAVTNYLNERDYSQIYVLGGEKAISSSLINIYQIDKQLNQLRGVNQVVLVTSDKLNSRRAALTVYQKKNHNWMKTMDDVGGVVGKNGLAKDKKEGDGKTPIGVYELNRAFGTSAKPSNVRLNYTVTNQYHYWIDDIYSNDYNKMKYYKGNPNNLWNSYEKLTHPLYSHAVVIEYNTNPIVKGKGSAIFLHVKQSSTQYTLGCVAIPKNDLVRVMQQLDPALNPQIIITETSSLGTVVRDYAN